jgi:release factor glutamine methyltransferase
MSTPIAHLLQAAEKNGLPRIDAQMLMLHACEQDTLSRAWLIQHDRDALSTEQLARWESAVQRRQQGEPVAYITGYKEFYGLRLHITPDVLDPRDDTETLVDWALELIPQDKPFKVLDLGTGSGAIAIAIQSQRPWAAVTATDASPAALQVAQGNARLHHFNIRFVLAQASEPNWLAAVGYEPFDLIVSNPPYIAQGDAHLQALSHEPALALASGTDGLQALRSITSNAPHHLRAGGHLLLEHGFAQAQAVRDLLSRYHYTDVQSRQDLQGHPRCSGGRWR